MKKSNCNGFTLVETLVTFMILALAGGMFILGFFNVSNIMSEAALIKNTTNDLYSSLIVMGDDLTLIEGQKISLKVNGSQKELDVNVYSNDQTINGNDSVQVRLRRILSATSVPYLPDSAFTGGNGGSGGSSGGGTEAEMNGVTAMFMLWTANDMWAFPTSQSNINRWGFKELGHVDFAVNYDTNSYFGTGVDAYIYNTPSESTIHKVIQDNRLEYLYPDGYVIEWVYVQKHDLQSFGNVPAVYGMAIATNTRYLVLPNNSVATYNGSTTTDWAPNNYAQLTINNQVYTKQQVLNGEFIKSNQHVYYATN